ncbi:MAG: lysophospholipase [Bacteroidales bacterium]|nr:lysophospholipase [Bacteroidales bacterium]
MITSMTLPASSDELTLAMLVSVPKTAPRGVVQFVHGMCEHKERYVPFMEWLTGHGLVCVIHDLRGHGASVKDIKDLGYLYDGGWQAMVEDVRVVSDRIRAQWPGLDYTLFGHSMGSMIVRSFAKRYDDRIDRLFVCGCPSDNPAKGAGKALAGMFGILRGWRYRPKLLQQMSFGAFNKPFAHEGWPAAWVCSDPETLEAYHQDPLCMYQFTANGFYGLMGLMQDCYSTRGWKVSRPQLPVHFISGAEDPCRTSDAALERAVALMRKIGYSGVDLKLYPGMRHEVLNETGRLQVWRDILEQIENK